MRLTCLVALLAMGCGNSAEPDGSDLAVAVDLSVMTSPPDLASSDDLSKGGAGARGDGGAFASHDQVDILFLVDNSPSMTSKQAQLRADFGSFVSALQQAGTAHPASYHLGVVTSDLGAGPYVLNNGQCHPAGDGAKLVAAPVSGAMGLPAACTSFSLGGGKRFIDYDQVHGVDNLGGTDLATAFSCISAVGESGCGFESQLEAVYQALHDPIVENAGFLRPDALLVVVFVTDEDDCSAPPTTDLFDPNTTGVSSYGPLHSFRCTQFGVACGDPATAVQPVDSQGPLTMCRPLTMAEGGKLIDTQKYADFFRLGASLGGVKADPSDVIVAAIAAPAAPLSTSVTSPCLDSPTTASCAILNHSCVAPGNAQLFADPAVRLSAVVRAAATSQLSSACDASYATALDGIAQKIAARLN